MTQDRTTNSRDGDDLEISLSDAVAPLRRHWKLLVVGTGLCWAILVLAYVLTPRLAAPRYQCEAVLSLPDLVTAPAGSTDRSSLLNRLLVTGAGFGGAFELESSVADEAWTPSTRVGVPLGLYRKVERAILDGKAVEAFAGKLDAATVARLKGGLGQRVSAIASFSRDDAARLEKDDAVGAVKLAYDAESADGARAAVEGAAAIVREGLAGVVARERIGWQARGCERQVLSLVRRKAELLDVAQSLDQLELATARTRQAESAHAARLCERAIARQLLRLRFLRQLETALDRNGAPVVADVTHLLDGETSAFLAAAGDTSAEARLLIQAEAEGVRDQLTWLRASTRFDQTPVTVRADRRVGRTLFAALGALSAMLFVTAAFFADLRQRRLATPVPQDRVRQRTA